jgi:hypothetical protein
VCVKTIFLHGGVLIIFFLKSKGRGDEGGGVPIFRGKERREGGEREGREREDYLSKCPTLIGN